VTQPGLTGSDTEAPRAALFKLVAGPRMRNASLHPSCDGTVTEQPASEAPSDQQPLGGPGSAGTPPSQADSNSDTVTLIIMSVIGAGAPGRALTQSM
jgi:hypothetical protein